MSTPLHHKRSAVQGKVPTTSDLALGELAINTYDGKIYLKKNVGGVETVIDVTSTASGASWGAITGSLANQTDLQAALDAKAATGHVHAVATGAVAGFMASADKTKLDGIAAGAQVNSITSVAGKTGAVTLAKGDVGLGSVDNTSDAAKPVSTAQATAIAAKVSKSGDTMSGTLAVNRGTNVADTTTDVVLSNGVHNLYARARLSGGSYNPLVQANDSALLFDAGAQSTGALFIGPWSGSSYGLRLTGAGGATLNGNNIWHAGNFDPATKLDKTGNGVITGNFQAEGGYIHSGSGAGSYATLRYDGALSLTGGAYYPIWTSGNFNPATKADTSHQNLQARLGAVAQTITDWNTATNNGWYMASGAANAPDGAWYIGIASQHNSLWCTQEVWNFTDGPTAPRYRRHKQNGTWSAWTSSITSTAPEFKQKTTTEMAMFVKNNSDTGWNPPAGKVFGTYYNEAMKAGACQFAYDYTNGGYQPLTTETSSWMWTNDGSTSQVSLTAGTYAFRGSLQATGPSAELVFFDRSTSRRWLWYGNDDRANLWNGSGNVMTVDSAGAIYIGGAAGATIGGNGSGLSFSGKCYFPHGETPYLLAANAGLWVRVPRTFVQSGDPGAMASDGDLWFW